MDASPETIELSRLQDPLKFEVLESFIMMTTDRRKWLLNAIFEGSFYITIFG